MNFNNMCLESAILKQQPLFQGLIKEVFMNLNNMRSEYAILK